MGNDQAGAVQDLRVGASRRGLSLACRCASERARLFGDAFTRTRACQITWLVVTRLGYRHRPVRGADRDVGRVRHLATQREDPVQPEAGSPEARGTRRPHFRPQTGACECCASTRRGVPTGRRHRNAWSAVVHPFLGDTWARLLQGAPVLPRGSSDRSGRRTFSWT